MENFNIREIKKNLPLGAISEIAARMKIHPIVVSQIFNEQRKSKYENEAVAIALEIIEAKKPNAEVMGKAKEMKLTTTNIFPIRGIKKKRKDNKRLDNFGGLSLENTFLMIGVVVAAVIGLVMWNKSKDKPTGRLI
jgi:hypothetical protein